MALSHKFITDPKTGFLETLDNISHPFTAERKTQFLELYKTNGIRLRRAARSMGISDEVVNRHLQLDPAFKKAFDAVEAEYIEDLEAMSRDQALTNPKAYVERIFQLKCMFPSKYGQEGWRPLSGGNVTINISGASLVEEKKRQEIIDAKIIDDLSSIDDKTPLTDDKQIAN